MRVYFFLVLVVLSTACSIVPDRNTWIKKAPDEWPTISLINEVWYQDGERYIHPSFEYAGTGFLIDTGTDTLAATAKHVLWIAKHSAMQAVNPNPYLEKWEMHPKGNLQDVVQVDQLINTDTSELLQGPAASIPQRDWLVFTTKSISPNIQALKPSFRQLAAGEKIYFLGYPYQQKELMLREARVLSAKGNRIVFTKEESDTSIGGVSGSPIIDSSGFLVGIVGGTSINPQNGANALYGISTHYLRKVLEKHPDLNEPLISITDFIEEAIAKDGLVIALEKAQELIANPANFFTYSISPEEINRVGDTFLENKQVEDAIAIFKFSHAYQSFFPGTYLGLGKAYQQKGDQIAAKKLLKEALAIWPDHTEITEIVKTLNQ